MFECVFFMGFCGIYYNVFSFFVFRRRLGGDSSLIEVVGYGEGRCLER